MILQQKITYHFKDQVYWSFFIAMTYHGNKKLSLINLIFSLIFWGKIIFLKKSFKKVTVFTQFKLVDITGIECIFLLKKIVFFLADILYIYIYYEKKNKKNYM